MRVTTRNARFQQWQALLANRTKRQRLGQLLVQGVRPINLAIEHGLTIDTLLHNADARLSNWARGVLDKLDAEAIAVAPELLAELADKDDAELVAVARRPDDRLGAITPGPDFLGVAFDRPTSPGNIGTLARSADAFGAKALMTTGHAADVWDPKAVRASTGSLFALSVARVDAVADVTGWLADSPTPVRVVGTDEHGDTDLAECDLTGPVLIVVGNETTGLARGWRDRVDVMARIPITGAASSLNAATAASIVLYEAARQRG